MKILISPKAEKELKKISKINQIALVRKIRLLKNKEVSDEEKLSDYKNIFRVRVGDYRIVYRKIPDEIFIVTIRHRREIYKLLKDLMK